MTHFESWVEVFCKLYDLHRISARERRKEKFTAQPLYNSQVLFVSIYL